ncbi:MAG: hypothetical protein K2X82_08715 [Gemmataceae bacterium]|nr:hypothetical protein [Gemmataceae bacterium]
MAENITRRATLKMAGSAAIGATLAANSATAADDEKNKLAIDKKQYELVKGRPLKEIKTYVVKVYKKGKSDYIVHLTSINGHDSVRLYGKQDEGYFTPQEGLKALTIFDRFNKLKVGFLEIFVDDDQIYAIDDNGTTCTAAPAKPE